jgi:hypothetical protein
MLIFVHIIPFPDTFHTIRMREMEEEKRLQVVFELRNPMQAPVADKKKS